MKVKKIPMRRCIGCMESKPKRELIRIVGTEDGRLLLDKTGKAPGRGTYLCPDTNCFAAARKKKAISRSLDMTFQEEQMNQLFEELKEYEEKNP